MIQLVMPAKEFCGWFLVESSILFIFNGDRRQLGIQVNHGRLNSYGLRPSVTRVNNPVQDADFTGIVIRPGGTRPILRKHPPPHNDAGRDEFYIAWWTRGCCFENCCRSNAHVPFTNETERTRLLMFCREYIAAPTGGGGSSRA